MKVFSKIIVNVVPMLKSFVILFIIYFNLTKDNTPSRLTSVAHLGGFLFYKPLAL